MVKIQPDIPRDTNKHPHTILMSLSCSLADVSLQPQLDRLSLPGHTARQHGLLGILLDGVESFYKVTCATLQGTQPGPGSSCVTRTPVTLGEPLTIAPGDDPQAHKPLFIQRRFWGAHAKQVIRGEGVRAARGLHLLAWQLGALRDREPGSTLARGVHADLHHQPLLGARGG